MNFFITNSHYVLIHLMKKKSDNFLMIFFEDIMNEKYEKLTI